MEIMDEDFRSSDEPPLATKMSSDTIAGVTEAP